MEFKIMTKQYKTNDGYYFTECPKCNRNVNMGDIYSEDWSTEEITRHCTYCYNESLMARLGKQVYHFERDPKELIQSPLKQTQTL